MRNFFWFAVLVEFSFANADDRGGAKDLSVLDRPLKSTIVSYQEVHEDSIRLPLDKVERINNRLTIDKELVLKGSVTDITYLLSDEMDRISYFESLKKQFQKVNAEI